MSSNDAALEPRGGPRLLDALVAGLVGVLAAALFAGLFDGGLPKPARAEEPAAPMMTVAAASGPAARPSAAGLCFHGPGGELLDFAPASGRCP
jgi:hypothetical protein